MVGRPGVAGFTWCSVVVIVGLVGVLGLSTTATADSDGSQPPPITLWSSVPDSVKATLLPNVDQPAIPEAAAIRLDSADESTTTAAPTTSSTAPPRSTTSVAPSTFVPTSTSVGNCHPSYIGVCLLPDAEDYDCEGGTGNGPLYVRGPFRVVGPDVYGLDGSGRGEPDGSGCE